MNKKTILIKAIINKSNGQINFSLPKKKVGKDVIEKAYSGKPIRMLLEEDD